MIQAKDSLIDVHPNFVRTVTAAAVLAVVSGTPILLTACGVSGGAGVGFVSAYTTPRGVQFVQQPTAGVAGSVVAPAPQVAAVDKYGKVVTSFTGPITVTLVSPPPGLTLQGTTTRYAVRGVATFDDLYLNVAGASYTLLATCGAMQAVTSAPFAVTPYAAGFSDQQTCAARAGARPVLSGDFNLDGKADLVIGNFIDNTISVLLGNGDGTFAAQQTYQVGLNPLWVVSGDFNGDGKPDLAVTNSTGNTVSVLMGKGNGTFQPQQAYAVDSDPNSSPRGLVSADLNGDGIADLAVANLTGSPPKLSVLLGRGDGTFRVQQQSLSTPLPDTEDLVAGDFNGDGNVDIVVLSSTTYPSISQGHMRVLLGHGDGTFQETGIYPLGGGPKFVVSGDFNGDSHLDLAVLNAQDATISVLVGHGDGTFQAQQTVSVSSGAGMLVGDFNGDGKADLVVTNISDDTVSVFVGNGDGTLQAQQSYVVGSGPYSVASGDFNGDHRPDLVITNQNDASASVLLHS